MKKNVKRTDYISSDSESDPSSAEKEFLLSSTQMKKLMEFNKEAGEKRKEQNTRKTQDETAKIGGMC